VLPPLFSRDERATLEAFTLLANRPEIRNSGDGALAAGRDRAIRERVQAESLARLSRELPVKPAFLPLLFDNASTPHAIHELAKRV